MRKAVWTTLSSMTLSKTLIVRLSLMKKVPC